MYAKLSDGCGAPEAPVLLAAAPPALDRPRLPRVKSATGTCGRGPGRWIVRGRVGLVVAWRLRDHEQEGSKMQRIRLIGLALMAVFAFGAIAAVAAQAEEAPFWTVGGTRLEAGQTRFLTAKEAKPFVLSGSGIEITCTETSVVKGAVLLGSNAGEPGTNDETVNFKTCEVAGNGTGAGCKTVTEPITTTNLKSELVLDTTKTKLLVLFQPASGVLLAELAFPAGCKLEKLKVTGSVLAEALNAKEEPITTSSAKELSETGFLKFPAAQPVDIWLIKGGVGKEVEAKALETDGTVAKLSGTALVLLESKEKWSALP
jgi:hypothetical protein